MQHRSMKRITHLAWSVLVLGGLGFMQACSEKSSGLAADPTIKAVFTEAEILDLTTILDFFEHQVCDLLQVNPDSIRDCYQAFFNNVASAQTTGVIYVPVPFDAQKEMYTHLSDAVFKEIWLRGTAVNQETGDTTVRMNLSFDGKYMRFLEELKTDYQILEAYRLSLSQEHKISKVMIETVLYNYQQYNMEDLRMRLFIALHYLTLNDMYERKNE